MQAYFFDVVCFLALFSVYSRRCNCGIHTNFFQITHEITHEMQDSLASKAGEGNALS